MSYHYRFIKITKEISNEIYNADTNKFISTMFSINPNLITDKNTNMPIAHSMFNQEDIFVFGSNFGAIKEVHDSSKELFSDKELNDYYKEYDFRVCDKETLLTIIEYYRKMILNSFKKLLTAPEKEIKNHIEGKIGEWENLSEVLHIEDTFKDKESERKYNEEYYPYDISLSNKIVASWLYEYEIFELVHILKTFDWEHYNLLFYGW
jgi:hypothetical protein